MKPGTYYLDIMPTGLGRTDQMRVVLAAKTKREAMQEFYAAVANQKSLHPRRTTNRVDLVLFDAPYTISQMGRPTVINRRGIATWTARVNTNFPNGSGPAFYYDIAQGAEWSAGKHRVLLHPAPRLVRSSIWHVHNLRVSARRLWGLPRGTPAVPAIHNTGEAMTIRIVRKHTTPAADATAPATMASVLTESGREFVGLAYVTPEGDVFVRTSQVQGRYGFVPAEDVLLFDLLADA